LKLPPCEIKIFLIPLNPKNIEEAIRTTDNINTYQKKGWVDFLKA
jgi:hypothetical protein